MHATTPFTPMVGMRRDIVGWQPPWPTIMFLCREKTHGYFGVFFMTSSATRSAPSPSTPAGAPPPSSPSLARIYDDRAFDRMPILADALEGRGVRQRRHPRPLPRRGPHVRGCWVVDLVLRKE